MSGAEGEAEAAASLLPTLAVQEDSDGPNLSQFNFEKSRRGRGPGRCVLHDGKWISPSEFETQGGKGSSKCWKRSILHSGVFLDSHFAFRSTALALRGIRKLTNISEVLLQRVFAIMLTLFSLSSKRSTSRVTSAVISRFDAASIAE